ncbi:MAG: hypothetical protein AAFW84_11670 [Cyanobacteria bacterium J06635_15]
MKIVLRSNRLALFVLFGMTVLIGFEAATASAALAQGQDTQACPYEWQALQPYAEVITQNDPLSLRETPGGRIIGVIPKGWAVVTLAQSSDGQWTRVTNQYGYIGRFTFDDTNLDSAWVSTRYLQDLGEFCEKPISMLQTSLSAASQAQQYAVNEDWLHLGDRIALS